MTRARRVVLALPRGFCAGVEMAIKAPACMVELFDPPVYCYHRVVHNRTVASPNTDSLEQVARESGCARVERVGTAADLPVDLDGVVGVTAGASVPNE